MVDVKILLGIIAAIGTLWKIATDMRNRWDEEIRRREKENKERIVFEEETKFLLDKISEMLSELKKEMKDEIKGLGNEVAEMRKEIGRVDERASSAHKKIDWVLNVITPILHHMKIPIKEDWPRYRKDEEEQEEESEKDSLKGGDKCFEKSF